MKGLSWDWGRKAEKLVDDFLRQQGWFTINLAELGGHGAPLTSNNVASVILPDLQRAKDGISRYCEIKFKDSPAWWRTTNELRHGVDLQNWDSYLTLRQISGMPVDLFIVEYRPREKAPPAPTLMVQNVDVLRNVAVSESKLSHGFAHKGGMIYWPRSAFDIMGEIAVDGFDGLSETVKNALHQWQLYVPKPGVAVHDSPRGVPNTYSCVICQAPAFLGFANRPLERYCPEHMPGLTDEYRRELVANVSAKTRVTKR